MPWRSLLAAAATSSLSAGIVGVANDLVAILALNASALQIGMLNALESAAFLFLALPAGWWLDRVDRRRALLGTQAIATLALLSVPLAWLAGALSFWQLALVSLLVGTAAMVWGLGLSALLPQIVGREGAASGFGQLNAAQTTAGLIAPGATGLVLTVLAAPLTFFFAAVLELLSGLIILIGLGRRGQGDPDTRPALHGDDDGSPSEAPPPMPFWAGLREGFAFSLRSPVIVMTTLTSMSSNATLAVLGAVETLYLVRELDFSTPLIGLVGMVIAASGLLGALLSARLLRRYPALPTSGVAAMIAALACVLLPLSSLARGNLGVSLAMVLSFNVLWNSCTVISNSARYGAVALLVPDELLGRVMAFRQFAAMGPVPLLSLLGGWLGVALGLLPTLWIACGLAAIAAGLSLRLWWFGRALEHPLHAQPDVM